MRGWNAGTADDEAEALAIANGTDHGLVAAVRTRDGARRLGLARALEAGQAFFDDHGAGGGVELSSGDVGRSEGGREKGFEALYGFTRLETVTIRHGRAASELVDVVRDLV